MRFFAVVLAMCLLAVSSAFAEIRTAKDEFDGTESMASIIKAVDTPTDDSEPMLPITEVWLMFTRQADGQLASSVFITMELDGGQDYADIEGKIKIDGKIMDLILIQQPADIYTQTKIAFVPGKYLKAIRSARSITLRVRFTKNGHVDWKVPAPVLSEWRDLIIQAEKKKFNAPPQPHKKTPQKAATKSKV